MAENKIPYKIYLDESEIPTKWYNVRADMKNKPAPLLNPATLKPMTHADLAPVFCDELIAVRHGLAGTYPIDNPLVEGVHTAHVGAGCRIREFAGSHELGFDALA